jgi:hypothetical protein
MAKILKYLILQKRIGMKAPLEVFQILYKIKDLK